MGGGKDLVCGPGALRGLQGRLDLRLWEHTPMAMAPAAVSTGVPAMTPSEVRLALGPSPFELIWKVLWEAGRAFKSTGLG